MHIAEKIHVETDETVLAIPADYNALLTALWRTMHFGGLQHYCKLGGSFSEIALIL